MKKDRVTANLPSRDFDATEGFYGLLGFVRHWRDESWMILSRGPYEVEFFPHPDLNPCESWFSACLRSQDWQALHVEWRNLSIPEDSTSFPRISSEITDFGPGVPRMFFMHDPDGTLWRVMEPEATT